MAFALPVMVTGAVTIGCALPSRRFTATEISPCPANGPGAAVKAGPAPVHGRQAPGNLSHRLIDCALGSQRDIGARLPAGRDRDRGFAHASVELC